MTASVAKDAADDSDCQGLREQWYYLQFYVRRTMPPTDLVVECGCWQCSQGKAKRLENLDVQGEKPVYNDAGELCLDDRAKQAARKEHYEHLSNVEFDWEPESLTEIYPERGPPPTPRLHMSWWSRPSSWL